MHYELDFGTWDTPAKLHEPSKLYIQRGKDGYGKREELKIPAGDMFRDELELFAAACVDGQAARADRARRQRRGGRRQRRAALDRAQGPSCAPRRGDGRGAGEAGVGSAFLVLPWKLGRGDALTQPTMRDHLCYS